MKSSNLYYYTSLSNFIFHDYTQGWQDREKWAWVKWVTGCAHHILNGLNGHGLIGLGRPLLATHYTHNVTCILLGLIPLLPALPALTHLEGQTRIQKSTVQKSTSENNCHLAVTNQGLCLLILPNQHTLSNIPFDTLYID